MTSLEQTLYEVNPDILIWLGAIETLLPAPVNSFKIDEWLEDAEEIADRDFNFMAEEWLIIQKILENFEHTWAQHFMNHHNPQLQTTDHHTHTNTHPNPKEHIEHLLNRTQTQQRTEEWFAEHQNLLTASEIGDLFDSDAALQSLIWSKIIPRPRTAQSAAVPSEYMTAFDWGIRFEPVVKQIYEHLYGATIEELGRLYHPTQSRLAASPDGLITVTHPDYGHLHANLIEIKCPVSRKPDGRIVPKYYHQMQLQLEVTGLHHCEFAEFIFLSSYKQTWAGSEREAAWAKAVHGGALHGYIFLVERVERRTTDTIENSDSESHEQNEIIETYSHRYEYGPVNDLSWQPQLDTEKEHIIETIPWALETKTQQRVTKDPAWWSNARPRIESFWMSVDERRKAFADGRIAPPSPKKRTGTGNTHGTSGTASQQQICVIKLG